VVNGSGSEPPDGERKRGEPGADTIDVLAARCQRGDRAACEALIEAYRPLIYTLVRVSGRDPDWVEDTAVEVMVQLYRSIGSFRWRSSLKTWVYSVATKVRAAELRRARRPRPEPMGLEERKACERGPVDLVLDKDEQEKAMEMVAQLPEKYRVAVVLRHVMGCTYPELAEILGVPLGTAKTRVFMGIRRIRDTMREGVGGEEE